MTLRDLPSVDEVLQRLAGAPYPRALVAGEIRRILAAERERLRGGNAPDEASIEDRVRRGLDELARPSLRHVINATGVVLHTNLGRAPLPRFEPVWGYSNLEYDVEAGHRGRRDVHAGVLLERLIGRSGIAVNNNAAAVYLALNELAAGYEVIVSRGELIEIGDGFRIPDIMARSGAVLREAGTTNKTSIEDYRAAVNDRTRLIMRVHPSNFRIEGFTAKPALSALAALSRERGIPLYEDLGSGCIVDLRAFGIQEPSVEESFRAGVDLVSFSGDKLLGGPQAGILAGTPELVARLRRNPMFRALRLDKLMVQALETTLRNLVLGRLECVPALRMIALTAEQIRERAAAIVKRLGFGDVVPGESVIGGGSTPQQSLPTFLVAIDGADVAGLARRLRAADPPVIARIEEDRLLLDLRTVFAEEEDALAAAVESCVSS